MLTGAEIMPTASGPTAVFETKVRLSDIQGNKEDASSSHSFSLVIGENLGWNSDASSNRFLVLSDSVALAVVFYQNAGVTSILVSNGTQGLDLNTAGFVASNSTAVSDSAWSLDTWYTVRISDIQLQAAGDGTNVTATLDIFNSDTSAALVSGVSFNANKGGETTTAGAFDQ